MISQDNNSTMAPVMLGLFTAMRNDLREATNLMT